MTPEDYFRARGHPAVTVLGRGMEGVVYDLGDGLVGKVWFQRTAADLQLTQAFLKELDAQPVPFATPLILDIEEFGGRAVTRERRLPGTDLRTLQIQRRIPPAAAYEATLAAVAGLAATEAGAATRALPVLDERAAFRAGQPSWPAALAALVQRRAATHRDVLSRRITGFGRKLERVLALLPQVPIGPDRILHGDICPPNVLVGADFQVTALVDWSFLTTAGDHVFEAMVAAGIFDMYGPDARASEAALTARLVTEQGCPPRRMLLYRAAYAIATANAYSADGSDGHFAWCAATLEREDVVGTLDRGEVD